MEANKSLQLRYPKTIFAVEEISTELV